MTLLVGLVMCGPIVSAEATEGDELWIERTPNVSPAAIASTIQGTIFVTGREAGGALGFATAAYRVDGSTAWVDEYAGPSGRTAGGAQAVDTGPDGHRIYVTGAIFGRGAIDFATIAYRADGSRAWVRHFGGGGTDWPADLATSPDGHVIYVTGEGRGGGSRDRAADYTTVAYRRDGTKMWVRDFNGQTNQRDVPNGIAVSPNGRVIYVTGHSRSDSGFDYATVAYRADGTRLWVRRYDGSTGEGDRAYDISVSSDSKSIYVTGISKSNTVDTVTIAYTSDGERLWARRFGDMRSHEVVVSPASGMVYVCGSILLAYEAKGDLEWRKSECGHVAPHPTRGIVFMTRAAQLSSLDYATTAYDRQGAELWAAHYDGPANKADYPTAITVRPDGTSVTITGFSERVDGSTVGATVAYDTSG